MTSLPNIPLPDKTTVLLAGATGYIGRFVLSALLKRGYRVITLGRTRPDTPKHFVVEHISCDLVGGSLPSTGDIELAEAYVVISCLGSRGGGRRDSWEVEFGANQTLLALAETLNALHFILLSAICVQKPKLEFQFAKLAFEEEVIKSKLRYSIVRPTAYFKSLAGQIENVKAGKAYLMFNTGAGTACKPISGHDLAAYICDCLIEADKFNKILPIGGSGPAITPREQGEMIFELLDRKPKIKKIPSGMFRVIAAALSPFCVFSERLSDKREFLRIAHYYATESMLLWDEVGQRYAPEKTPEYGQDGLRDFYASVLRKGVTGHELKDHKLF